MLLMSWSILALLVLGPTWLVWLRSGKKLSLQSCFVRALVYDFTAFGVCFSLVASLIFLCALLDQFGITKFGYSTTALIATGVGSVVGFGFFAIGKAALNKDAKERSKH